MTSRRAQEIRAGLAWLHAADPVLAQVIDDHPGFDPDAFIQRLPAMDLFGALVFQVIGQQTSVIAATAIFTRLTERFGGRVPGAGELAAVDEQTLHGLGLSRRKAATVLDLPQRFADGRLSEAELRTLPDEEVIRRLTEVKGIGSWTAAGALLIALRRPDLVRANDLALRRSIQIFFKDWGTGQPIVFSHGWPLSSDDWDAQLLFFLHHGYRVIAHDRRGHGRSAQVSDGNDVDHYADDLADLTAHLDLHDAVHIGHSAGGGEVARYLGRHGEDRVAKVILVSAVTPSVLQTDANPAGVPQAAFEGFQAALAANRAEFYQAVASGPFYNFDQPGVTPSEPVIANWWRQGMMGGAKGQYDQISEFIRQDYSEDLKKISVPVLAMNGDADQVVPHDTSGPRAVKLVQNGTLKTYPGFPHGMLTTHADTINPDLLAFIRS